MSEFFRALEQAERDRAVRQGQDGGRDTATVRAPRASAPVAEPEARAAVAPPVAPPPVAPPPPAPTLPPAPPAATPSPFVRPPAPVVRPPAPAPHPPVAPGIDAHLVSLVRPASVEAEQYRVLRHLVEQTRAGKACVLVAVSSPGAGDGKTMTSINLAGALAQDPTARVLIIDADLRRPSVAKIGRAHV